MTEPIIPLIMCGGAGTRLWPASREGRPKQFLALFGPRSTFQDTIRRVGDPKIFGKPIIVTNHQYRFLVAEQLSAIGVEADILLEPHRRDSAPAIVAGAVHALRRGKAPIVLALAADHVVTDADAFVAACLAARTAAEEGYIVTFGVTPERPATEYGYIRRGKKLVDGVFAAEKFVEKPDEATARSYVADGYLWNSGNFIFGARALLDEYRRLRSGQRRGRDGGGRKRRYRSRLRHPQRRMTFPARPQNPSTTPCWRRHRAPPWCRSPMAGPTSARGTPSGN